MEQSFDTRMADVDYLHSIKAYLEDKQRSFLEALKSLSSTGVGSAKDCLVQIGADFWCLKSMYEAEEFYYRQINRTSQALKQVLIEIDKQQHPADNSQRAVINPGDNGNDQETEALPIVEILEQLDSSGNVVDVKLNDVPFSMQKKEGTQTQHALSPKPSKSAALPAENLKVSGTSEHDVAESIDGQVSELFHDMEILSSHTGKEPKLSTTDGEQARSITEIPSEQKHSNIYELELIAGSFHEHDDDTEGFDHFDYEFEDSDEDPDEDSDGETFESDSRFNFMSEMDTSLLPRSSTASSRLREEIIALRRSKSDQESSQNERKVRFKDTLDIREIENISQELKEIEHKSQKVSRFKEAKILQTKSPLQYEGMKRASESSSENVVAPFISEMIPSSLPYQQENSSDVTFDICEKKPQNTPLSDLDWQKSSTPTLRNIPGVDENVQSLSIARVDHPDNSGLKNTNSNTRATGPSSGSSTMVPLLTEYVNDDMGLNSMVAAYHRGDYDNDVSLTGPIVNKLDDFEKLNKLMNSMNIEDSKRSSRTSPVPENSISAHEFNAMNEIGSFESDSSDEEIMTDRIIEHELDDFSNSTEMEEVNDPERIKQDIIEREVSEQYHRLRQRLRSQNDTSHEGTDYSSKRISRFKSKRFQT